MNIDSFLTALDSLTTRLEEDAEERRVAAEVAERERELQRERDRLAALEQQRLEVRARIERERAERLHQQVADWRFAREAREYLSLLEGRLAELDATERVRLTAWLEWARDHVEKLDPLARDLPELAGAGRTDE